MENKQPQTVLVTGASSGIGLALTKAFHANGFNVVANSRTVAAAGTLTADARLTLAGGDVGYPATGRNLVDVAVARYGRLDVLINNAGIFVPKPFDEYTLDDYRRVVDTNLGGFFHVTQAALRQMRKQGKGQILSISTTLAQQPVAGVNAGLSSLTKGGLNAATRGLAIEYAKTGIRFNTIAPGIIDTPMHKPEHHAALKQLHPIQRLGTVDEIVDAALFLVRSSFITGEILHVDGGAHAGKW